MAFSKGSDETDLIDDSNYDQKEADRNRDSQENFSSGICPSHVEAIYFEFPNLPHQHVVKGLCFSWLLLIPSYAP